MTASSPHQNPSARLDTLDVLGIGLSVEMLGQSEILDGLKKNPRGAILPSDPDYYPESAMERQRELDKRSAGVLAAAAKGFVEHWPIPAISIWPYRDMSNVPADNDPSASLFSGHIEMLRKLAGMDDHQISPLPPRFNNQPEGILELIFRAFEQSPDIPALLALVTDGDMTRQLVGDVSREAHWGDGPRRHGSMADSVVAILFARRDRIDTLIRPYAGSRGTHIYAPDPGKPGFKPSHFLPKGWTADQLDQFDALPTLAVVHRPVRLSYRTDKDGKPTFDPSQQSGRLLPPQKREAVFKEAFDAALAGTDGKVPRKIFYDTGGVATGGHVVPLSMATNAALPDMDLFSPEEGYNISVRIGDMGAASPFAMWALASLASREQRSACAAINLRQSEEASITMVTPPAIRQRVARASAPASTAMSPNAAQPVQAQRLALGARVLSGDECPQSGMWRSDPPDAQLGNASHYLWRSRTMPKVTVLRKLTAMQKLRGDSPYEKVSAAWTLESYDAPV